MSDARSRLYVDLVDPGSYLMDLRVGRAAGDDDARVVRAPFEIRPPPEPLLRPEDPGWRAYFDAMADALGREGRAVRVPTIVPWTRKAHELVAYAAETDTSTEPGVRRALFRRFLEEGEDIGRVDVLLAVAVEAGFDRTEVKATLDVDRHAHAIETVRAEATSGGIRGVPTLARGSRTLEGIHDEEAIRAFLRDEG